MNAPELLLPAGSLQHMRYAYAYGADAVYAGQPRYSLRVRNNDFHKLPVLAQGIEEAHALGKQFFVASNLMPHNAKIKTYMADMEPVIEMKPDALIMADPGLIMMVRERWPEMPVHLSVQANTVNYQAVKFWQSVGVSRVILSRELSLDEIEEIRQLCPDMELEVFVHGALCIAYSGRCLLSGYFNHRDPNQGSCTNSCRWDYKTHASDGNDDSPKKIEFKAFDAMNNQNAFSDCGSQERHPLADDVYLIEEGNRPGELMPIFEDEHGTYIMNSKDLRAIQHIERLTKIGVDSLKIEGRTKSVYYVARTAQIYRRAIDDALAGRKFDPTLIGKLDNLANRGYTDGFYQRHPTQEQQNYIQGYSSSDRQQYVGEITGYDAQNQSLNIDVKNKFSIGDKLELVLPEGNVELTLEKLLDKEGEAIEVAPGSGHQVKVPYVGKVPEKGLLARYI
ncbi:MAG: tRNA 5-hydroxyuridine modification protein YegQ [Gammaproteobacteria bacterium]|nr:tRNA 5-hydroxyuridine modification protein YegQ [Gammaproteobacteria bacterium]MDH5591299.1 tRNA 5-hydroxyuridine modification protein YegQ [Gammaproteobacteria bacterium]